jgi:DNA-binding response OmpR family regulator
LAAESRQMKPLFRFTDHTIVHDGHVVPLTAHDCAVLGMLAKHPLRVVSFERLCGEMWPMEADQPDDFHNQIAVHIHKLRAKLEPFGLAIKNVWGAGYYLEGELEVDWSVI